mgnify:CR=1 FL=1
MILVDSNVLMYAMGSEHPNKSLALGFLNRIAQGELLATIDAEVLQEIIHRYRSLNRWPEGKQAYTLARSLFPEVLPISGAIMAHATDLVDSAQTISAGDAVHAAVVVLDKLEGICTFDRDFDRIPGCTRIDP